MGIEDLRRFEEPQLVRYKAGQHFSWHCDAVPPTLLVNGGQRLATLLVYLNDVPSGGRTSFRDLRAGGTDESGKPLRLQVAPRKGRALLFFHRRRRTARPTTAHCTPVSPRRPARKRVAQLWLHETAYKPTVPAASVTKPLRQHVLAFAQKEGIEDALRGRGAAGVIVYLVQVKGVCPPPHRYYVLRDAGRRSDGRYTVYGTTCRGAVRRVSR